MASGRAQGAVARKGHLACQRDCAGAAHQKSHPIMCRSDEESSKKKTCACAAPWLRDNGPAQNPVHRVHVQPPAALPDHALSPITVPPQAPKKNTLPSPPSPPGPRPSVPAPPGSARSVRCSGCGRCGGCGGCGGYPQRWEREYFPVPVPSFHGSAPTHVADVADVADVAVVADVADARRKKEHSPPGPWLRAPLRDHVADVADVADARRSSEKENTSRSTRVDKRR